MRLTNNMMERNYLTNLNNSLNTLNNLNQEVATSRSFQKISDDPTTAAKAFQVRNALSNIGIYQSNIADAKNTLADVETNVSALKQIVTSVQTQVSQGQSGTYNDVDRKSIASALRDAQQEILAVANAKSGDKFIFGGSNVNQTPFTLDSSGNLFYNGTNVDTATIANEAVYSDVGMGFSMDASNNVIPQTAFNIANSGSQLLGAGTDSDGISKNLYNIVGQIATMFEKNDLTNIDKYVNKLSNSSDNVIMQYTNIGSKNNFLDFLNNRLESSKQDNTTKQTSLETVDQAKSILDYKNQENAYTAALQMGTTILQSSLMDYLK